MGNKTSKIPKPEYVVTRETENYFVAKKGDETFIVKKIPKNETQAISEIGFLTTINHPHIVDCKNSFTDAEGNLFVVMEFCQGGNLASNIMEMSDEAQEFEILSCFTEICIALKSIHDKGLLHKNLSPKNILLTEFRTVRLSGFEALQKTEKSSLDSEQNICYLAPEVFQEGTYDLKSDIWSLGCILFEICTNMSAFPNETPITLIPKIISGPCPTLPENISADLHELMQHMLKKNRRDRPTVHEILAQPIFVNCLKQKCETCVEELKNNLKKLRTLADGLEKFHERTTIGSLAGGVFGAAGGITSIVGLILAPFTLGASLIVTGVGVGVSVAGGIAAGASNITNVFNESSDRKAINSIIKEFDEKIKAFVTWQQEISDCLQSMSHKCPQTKDTARNNTTENQGKFALRAARGLGGIPELVRLIRVTTIGKLAAQTARAVRALEVATGVLSGLFLAVDVFFIAMDAKEVHNIKKARAAGSGQTESEVQDTEPLQAPEIKSEIMRFVKSVREAADNLEEVLDELENMISTIPSFAEENNHNSQETESLSNV